MAQSAFRKRQAQAKKSRETENSVLKSAIAAILDEMQPGDRPKLQAKIRQASELAGLDRSPEALHQEQSPSSSSECNMPAVVASPPDVPAPVAPSALIHGDTTRKRIEESLGFTIYPDPLHCSSCRQGIAVATPFLGSGAFTFSGRLFWHIVDRHESGVHVHESLEEYRRRKQWLMDTTLPMSDSDSDDMETRLQDLVARNPTATAGGNTWHTMIESRTNYHKENKNYIPAPASARNHCHPKAWAAESAGRLKVYRQARNWLSLTTVEKRLRAIVGDEVFAVMATRMLERWEKRDRDGRPLQDSPELMEGFLDRLSASVICLGELGPHWDLEDFDTMFREWCSSVMGGGGFHTA